MEWAEPPLLPSLTLPEAPILPNAVLEVPRAQLPSYKPLVAPPNTLRPPPGIKGINTEDEPPQDNDTKPQVTTPPVPPESQIVEVPFTDLEVPMPSTIIMTTAITTALISVAATLLATSLFKYIVMVSKPIIKQAWTKLTKKKNQKAS
jgi:hypothetical protein